MNMKRASYLFAVCAVVNVSISGVTREGKALSEPFSIKLEPKWKDLWIDLEKNKKRKIFQDKWILVGEIIIRKTASDYVSMHELHLTWHSKDGKKLEKLIASLYEKNSDKNFMPIEKYLICDSIWKKSEQRLILKFEKPKTLYAVNTLSLVLTVPNDMIETLKNGHFTIDSQYLPEAYKEYAAENNLCLFLGN